MAVKKKTTARNLQAAICLAYVAFLCGVIILPLKAEACGWYGENKYDDDDSVLAETDVNPVLDGTTRSLIQRLRTGQGTFIEKGRKSPGIT